MNFSPAMRENKDMLPPISRPLTMHSPRCRSFQLAHIHYEPRKRGREERREWTLPTSPSPPVELQPAGTGTSEPDHTMYKTISDWPMTRGGVSVLRAKTIFTPQVLYLSTVTSISVHAYTKAAACRAVILTT